MAKIPKQCYACKLYNPGPQYEIKVEIIKTPKPKYGEVLIQVHYSPLHPVDISFLQGAFGKNVQGLTPGYEGSGKVVQSGGGFLAWKSLNTNVAFICGYQGDKTKGCWAQYITLNAMQIITIPKNLDLKQGSCAFLNPLTSLMFLEKVKENKSKVALQTAAAGALGKMFFKLANNQQIEILNIVRSESQVEILKQYNAQHILNSKDEDFKNQLENYCKKLNIKVGFDCVGGTLLETLIECMGIDAKIYIFGNLSKEKTLSMNYNKFLFQWQSLQTANVLK